MFTLKRSDENPVLLPSTENEWEKLAVLNGCPSIGGGKTHFVYRAVSSSGISSIGYANSRDGIHFKNRRQFIKSELDWERFGCEDPRVTKLGSSYYIFYTALSQFPFNADGIKIGLAITKDFKKIKEKHLVTQFNAKAMALFPEKINGKFVAVLTVNTDRPPSRICIATFNKEEEIWSKEYWDEWYSSLEQVSLNLNRTTADHVEVGAPPIKTKHGWLLMYSHIQNYFAPPAVFGIEALLLDLKDPSKIIARTDKPLFVPQAEYEKYGMVPNIVFPSGVSIRGGKLYFYYGAADTVCALAVGKLDELIKELLKKRIQMSGLERYRKNPIIIPNPSHEWESRATFNAGVQYLDKKVHILYRAMSDSNTSVLGYASSPDGFIIDERLPEPAYIPREDFEKKGVPGGNSGCEDPRLTKIGKTIYMLYTAYNGKETPRVALTSILATDFAKHNWNWEKPVLISPPGVDDKDAALFPKKINGKFAILHRLGVSIWIDFVDDLNFGDKSPIGKWLDGKILMNPRQGERDSKKIGIAGPPIETEEGWLLIYHGVSKKSDNHYHLRAALLDPRDPTKVIVRTKDPILEVETSYEKFGIVPNVVFSNGSAVVNGKLFVYYGGADKVIGVATIKVSDLLKRLVAESKKK